MEDKCELMRLVESHFRKSSYTVLLAFRVVKTQAPVWILADSCKRLTSKSRILTLTVKLSSVTQKLKIKLQVLKQNASGNIQTVFIYNLKGLSKVEVVETDKSGCTFVLGFDDLKARIASPPEWTMRNIDERNLLLTYIMKQFKENLGQLPKILGMDIVDFALWKQENPISIHLDGLTTPSGGAQHDSTASADYTGREMVSKAEESDMDTLLSLYDIGIKDVQDLSMRLNCELTALRSANVHDIIEGESVVDKVLRHLEAASVSADDLDERLRNFSVKLHRTHEEIRAIESTNSALKIHLQNNGALATELQKLLSRIILPKKYKLLLRSGTSEESDVETIEEASEWLVAALCHLEPPFLDPAYLNMNAVRNKLSELEELKTALVNRASNFLLNHFENVVHLMIGDKSYFFQTEQLKRRDHTALRFKFRSYGGMLQKIKNLDVNALAPLRKAYCSSLNLLLRKEARDFVSELRAQVKNSPTRGSGGSSSNDCSDISSLSDVYAKMLWTFIPILVDESSFFASFMCFKTPPTGTGTWCKNVEEDDDINGKGSCGSPGQNPVQLQALDQALQDLLGGVEGMTKKYLDSHKSTEAAGFVFKLLTALQARITLQFNRFVEEENHRIETYERKGRQVRIIGYIKRFSALAHRMESLTQGISRDMVDSAYKRLVETIFAVLERAAQLDPKHADVTLLENYAAFWNCMFDLATEEVDSLGPYIHQASEAYEQACIRYVDKIINFKFGNLFQFAKRVENLLHSLAPQEVPFQIHFSEADLRKTFNSTLKRVEKSFEEMHNSIRRDLANSEELVTSIWEKCKEEFVAKYEELEDLVIRCYPTETLCPSSAEMKELLTTFKVCGVPKKTKSCAVVRLKKIIGIVQLHRFRRTAFAAKATFPSEVLS